MTAKKISISLFVLGIFLLTNFIHGNSILSYLPTLNLSGLSKNSNEEDENETIQVALLLDTSGSMDGLIEQAKSQLWNILNELARTNKNGEETSLEIALYEYGSSSRGDAFEIHQLTHFTSDMDLISEKLFDLTTSGSREYCGLIIQAAVEELEWKYENGLKIIYIAGNETFNQGRVSYARACGQAKEKGIIVNTIFCGPCDDGVRLAWKNAASTGNGDYLCINQNEVTAYITTPYDDEINKLNNKLNSTYIPYGKMGKSKKENQLRQDSNASQYSMSNAADRAAFKSSKKYKTDNWDLVSAYQNDKNVLNNKANMPGEFQGITIEEMEAKIEAAIADRESIQAQIKLTDEKRRKFKAENQPKVNNSDLQSNIVNSLRKQAKEKGFEVKN